MESIIYLNFEDEDYYSLWVMDADGSDKRKLTQTTTGDRGHSNHPERETILFWAFHEAVEAPTSSDEQEPAVTSDLFLVNMSGEMKQVTINEANDMNPSWSPNGDTILFESDRRGDFDLFTLPRIPPVMEVVTEDVEFDGGVYPGDEVELSVLVDYLLEENSSVWIVVKDAQSDEMVYSETMALIGTGTKQFKFSLTTPEYPGGWNLRVEAWFMAGSSWSHTSENWYHTLSVQVISEFSDVTAIVSLTVVTAISLYAVFHRRLEML
jgi:hypothetical protein